MGKPQKHRQAFTVRLNEDDRALADWLGQHAADQNMTRIIKLALYQFAGITPPASLAALQLDLPQPTTSKTRDSSASDQFAAIMRELATLQQAVKTQPVTIPTPASENIAGIDMGGPRRKLTKPAEPAPRIPEPALSPEDSVAMLLASVKGFKRD